MNSVKTSTNKIINDPVHGFITIPNGAVLEIMEHPFFQRLRRIKQLALTHYVYPGATHTRLQHALGALHLMDLALQVIRSKGHEITDEEAEASLLAILLHDIGHGPYSHVLEDCIVESISHEEFSLLFMNLLNKEFSGRLSLAIAIYNNTYHKKFLHQLVSSQLDTDRLDYLKRDCYFTGVVEGVIGSDRIIKMLNVVDDRLVVENKGIYSIEKFLIARRLMFWQVYFHKTVISAEQLLIKVLQRAKYLANKKIELFAPPSLSFFLYNSINKNTLLSGNTAMQTNILEQFAMLDDYTIFASIQEWAKHPDKVLAQLSENLINRRLYKIEIQNEPFSNEKITRLQDKVQTAYDITAEETKYFVFCNTITNKAYSEGDDKIRILYNNGKTVDIAMASDMLDPSVLFKTVKKYFLCYPKNCQ